MKNKFVDYRSLWMGIAIIWIIIYHYDIRPQIQFLDEITYNGYGGVDIFLFASGLGCYFSLQKEPDPAAFKKTIFQNYANLLGVVNILVHL